MSVEDNVTVSPPIRKHATFGEDQMNMQAMRGSREDELRMDPRYQQILKERKIAE